MYPDALVIDGSRGEGGGQILRTAVTLAALTGRAVRLHDIRAGRPRPGLAAQHLAAVRAAAELCDARLEGDAPGSPELLFEPRRAVVAGAYTFDVGAARRGGSAGSTMLVLQCVAPLLARADGTSAVVLRGGTHVPWSPSVDYVRDVWLPVLAPCGLEAELVLERTGWYPVGRGEVRFQVRGLAGAGFRPLRLEAPGALQRVTGRAIAAELPAHVCQRMASRAASRLEAEGIATGIGPVRLRAACPGAGLFLAAEYDRARAGFGALGEPGRRSEDVADAAVDALLAHRAAGAAVDLHLADQLVVPLALASGPSAYTVERVTRHLTTNAWVVGKVFGVAAVRVAGREGEPGLVTVEPRPMASG